MSSDPRCYPAVELSRRQARAMLRPVLGGAELGEFVRVGGGLVNTVYRVAADAPRASYALRVYAAGARAFETERRLLPTLAAALPVPEVLFADASGRRCAYPYLVYRWIDGVSLNECRRQTPQDVLLTLAEPLGRLLARIAAALPAAHVGRMTRITTRLVRAEEQLRAGAARERLGGELADRLRQRLDRSAPDLLAHDHGRVLVHGDFGGRNILVKVSEGGGWEIGGVIDWEEAAAGSALWDVGSLFRYPRRYSEEFRALFARGHRAAGGSLPPAWWTLARTADATRLAGILSEERELPHVFAECVGLIRSVVDDSARTAVCRRKSTTMGRTRS